jgi:HEAT repeat protein
MALDEKEDFSQRLEQTFYELPEYTVDDGAYTRQRVRSFYFRALALNTDRPYRPFAVQALTDPDLRVEAIHLLGEKGAWEEVEQTVSEMLEDPEPGNRSTAVELLRYAPTRSGMKLLVDQLDDPDEAVRTHCLQRLGELAQSMMLSESLQNAVSDTPESILAWKVWRDENLR